METKVGNEMRRQTWLNLTSRGHTLPEETGASRLASTLIALYVVTHKPNSPCIHTHTDTKSQTHVCIHAHCKLVLAELLYHRGRELVRTQL